MTHFEKTLKIEIIEKHDYAEDYPNQIDELRVHNIRDGLLTFMDRVLSETAVSPAEEDYIEMEIIQRMLARFAGRTQADLLKERIEERFSHAKAST